MRILYVTTVSTTIRAFLLPFIQHYRRLGARVDVAASGVTADNLAAICDSAYELNWSRSLLDGGRSARAALRLRRIVAEGGYDIVHVHTPIASFCTRCGLAGVSEPRPAIIYTAHGFHFHQGGHPLSNMVWSTAERLAARWTDYLVVINQEDAAYARERRILPSERIIEMPGIGVDTTQMQPESVPPGAVQQFRESLSLKPTDQLFLMIAEFIPRKRHVDALRAFAKIRDSMCHLALAGTGALLERMRGLAGQLGIADRVHFLGFRIDVATCIKASAAVVLPSTREGLPRSIMEAFCLGTPVIATDVRGNRDLVNGNGTLVPVCDPEALAIAMQRVLSHPEEVASLVGRASRAIRKYDIATVLSMHDALYSRAVQSTAERSGSETGLAGIPASGAVGHIGSRW